MAALTVGQRDLILYALRMLRGELRRKIKTTLSRLELTNDDSRGPGYRTGLRKSAERYQRELEEVCFLLERLSPRRPMPLTNEAVDLGPAHVDRS